MMGRATWFVCAALLVLALHMPRARADEPLAGELSVAPSTALALRADAGWLSAATIDGVGVGLGAEGRWAPIRALFVGLAADTRLTWLGDGTGNAAGRVGLARVGLTVGTGAVIRSTSLGAHLVVEAAPSLLGLSAIDAGATRLVVRGALELGWRDERYGLRLALDGGAGVDDGASAFIGGRVDATRTVSGALSSLVGLELRGGLGVGVAFRGRLGVTLSTPPTTWRVALVVGAGGAEPLVLGLELGVVLAQPADSPARGHQPGGISGR